MNKKFMAMLMAIVMVISMVPMTALAAECTVDHSELTYVYQNNGKCQAICECGYTHTKTCSGNPCNRCGNYVEPEAPACNGVLGAYVSNGNGTHTAACACGNVTNTRDCEIVDGVCGVCGYTVPGCNHELGNYVSNGDGTHSGACACGEITHTGRCQKGADGKCATCDYTFPAAEPECDDELGDYVPNGDGTHTASCECGNVTHTRNCDIVDGVCVTCGYVVPACDHELGNYVSNGDGTHSGACDCGKITHTGRCQKGADGKCATCGYTFPVDEPECDHVEGAFVGNGDGTHTATCACGNITHTRKCEIVNGVCVICGAKEPVAPQEPVVLPVYAAVSTVGLDNVPKTGCAFVEWLYALIFG